MMTKELFGQTKCGENVFLYSLENENGMKAVITNYGAILVSLFVPDKNGKVEDVVLGYDKLEDYFVNGCFFGATIAPNANRIGNASFSINGTTYQLAVNDGVNNLHSDGEIGAHKRVWEVEEGNQEVTLSVQFEDGEMGFPGKKELKVTYRLTEDNQLILHYKGTGDKDTIMNPTNHTYFNLGGAGSESVDCTHSIQLLASNYTPADAGSIPTGEIASVKGTPMDLREMTEVGAGIDAAFEQLQFAGGYDHNWVIDDFDGTVKLFATVEDVKSGRIMKAYTDLPGVQFYAGNFIAGEEGKNKKVYGKRAGLCLETQFYPDTANKPEFPTAIFGPERPYTSTTIYEFL